MMSMYTKDSIVEALKATNPDLQIATKYALQCPSPGTHPECKGDPNTCDRCNTQSCIQRATIYKDSETLPLITLNFNFMILIKEKSGSIRTGFLYDDDRDLKKLTEHKYIETKDLVAVTENDLRPAGW